MLPLLPISETIPLMHLFRRFVNENRERIEGYMLHMLIENVPTPHIWNLNSSMIYGELSFPFAMSFTLNTISAPVADVSTYIEEVNVSGYTNSGAQLHVMTVTPHRGETTDISLAFEYFVNGRWQTRTHHADGFHAWFHKLFSRDPSMHCWRYNLDVRLNLLPLPREDDLVLKLLYYYLFCREAAFYGSLTAPNTWPQDAGRRVIVTLYNFRERLGIEANTRCYCEKVGDNDLRVTKISIMSHRADGSWVQFLIQKRALTLPSGHIPNTMADNRFSLNVVYITSTGVFTDVELPFDFHESFYNLWR